MQIRLEQSTVNAFKDVMQKFLPKYLYSNTIEMPETLHYEFGFFFNLLNWKIDWTDIVSKKPDLDIKDIKLNFTKKYDFSLVKLDFPAIKEWEIDAMQEVNSWILPSKSQVELIFKDFDVDFACDFKLDDKGYLDPIFYDVDIKFGESYLYHDNKIMAFVMHQFVFFGIVIVQNSVYFVGNIILSDIGGPIMDEFLNDYKMQISLPSPFKTESYKKSTFTFDYRNTQSPNIQEGYIDLFFLGEILYEPHKWLKGTNMHGANSHVCTLEPDYMTFSNTDIFSQLVISESAATCMANSFAASSIGLL